MSQQLPDRKLKDLEAEDGWHNVFHDVITSAVDETIFKELYDSETGRPNAPIRQLFGMIVLKEGHGWTDEELFEHSRYNLKVMRALGINNLREDVPSESTYYEFKKKLAEHFRSADENLIEEAFEQLTAEQIEQYDVLADKVRMDSKLIQSNISQCDRLQLVLKVVSAFYKGLTDKERKRIKKDSDQKFLTKISQHTASNLTYRMSEAAKTEWLQRLGLLIRKLLNIYRPDKPSNYEVLERLFEEQYEQDDEHGRLQPRPDDQIESDSLQSPYDTEATYRKKGHGQNEQQVSGYTANVSETCSTDGLNLITDVQLGPAHRSDDSFLTKAIERTERRTKQSVEGVWTDGGYDSYHNRFQFDSKEWKGKHWWLAHTKGRKITYEFEWLEDEQTYLVTDTITETEHKAEWASNDEYKITSPRGTRYFEPKFICSYIALRRVCKTNPQLLKTRANVEATIRQMFCKMDGNKTRYRGYWSNFTYVLSRAIWTNFRRIHAQTVRKGPNTPKQPDKKAKNAIVFILNLWNRWWTASIQNILNWKKLPFLHLDQQSLGYAV